MKFALETGREHSELGLGQAKQIKIKILLAQRRELGMEQIPDPSQLPRLTDAHFKGIVYWEDGGLQ